MRRRRKSQKGGSEREALLKRAYKRIADESVPFCERGGTTALVTDFCASQKSERSKVRSDVALTPNCNTMILSGAFALKEKFHGETFLF